MTASTTTVPPITVNPATIIPQLRMCLGTKLVPMISGSPGIGKSDIVNQIADSAKLFAIDVRLSQSDPTDLNGFPRVISDRSGYAPMETFPLEIDKLPDGYNGWLLFLDEINSAPLAMQAASYKLILDRMIGKYKLHGRVFIICAGNLMTDGAIVNKMGTAMQTRLVHLELVTDHKSWALWASKHGIAHEVLSYINHVPTHLHDFDPNHNDKTYACPRTWEFTSRIVQWPHIKRLRDKLPALAGTISQPKAMQFVNYCDVYPHIPTYAHIKKDPKTITVPDEPSMLAALSGIIGSNLVPGDADKVLSFVERMPLQFQIFTMRDALRRNEALLTEQSVIDYADKHAEELY